MTLMTLATQDEPVRPKPSPRNHPGSRPCPPGVPKTIDPDAYPSLTAMLVAACRQHAERPAFECLGAQMTFAEWDRDSRDFAAFLVEEVNCRPGERVAIMLPNMFAYPVSFLGTLRAGLIVVNVNPLATPRELQHQLADSPASVIDNTWRTSPTSCRRSSPTRKSVMSWWRGSAGLPTPVSSAGRSISPLLYPPRVPAWHFENFRDAAGGLRPRAG